MFHSNRLLILRDQRTGSGEGRKQKHRALAGPDARRCRGRWPRHQSLQWSGSVEGLSGDQIAVGIKSGSHGAVGLLQTAEVLQACRFTDTLPLRGYAPINAFRYYQLWTGPGDDAVTISLSPTFGDPDLFVSADALLPNTRVYTYSSREHGADAVVIRHPKPRTIYYIGVLGSSSAVAYTITSSVSESLTTLLAGVPLANEELAEGTYRFYRLFVDSAAYGLTV